MRVVYRVVAEIYSCALTLHRLSIVNHSVLPNSHRPQTPTDPRLLQTPTYPLQTPAHTPGYGS